MHSTSNTAFNLGSIPSRCIIKENRGFIMARVNKLYSETMRELSELDEDSLTLYAMRWGLIDGDTSLIDKVGIKVFEQIPPATAIQKNALLQILASFDDSIERREWADRIEGKATQRLVNINHDTSDGVDSLKDYTKQKLDELFGGL